MINGKERNRNTYNWQRRRGARPWFNRVWSPVRSSCSFWVPLRDHECHQIGISVVWRLRLATIDSDIALTTGTARIAKALGLTCPTLTVSTACSSGTSAIAHAWHRLKSRRIRSALCVGVDELWAGSVLSFGMIGALSQEPCDPYGRSDGTSIGEGAAAVLLTTTEGPGNSELGYVVGVGQSTDAYHPSRPDPTGQGPFLASARALTVANLGRTSGFDLGSWDRNSGERPC